MNRVPLLLAGVVTFVPLACHHGPASSTDEQAIRERLTRLAGIEERFHRDHHRYASPDDIRTDTVLTWPALPRIAIIADSTRYVALVTSATSRMQCIVWAGSPRPATAGDAPPGVPKCWTP